MKNFISSVLILLCSATLMPQDADKAKALLEEVYNKVKSYELGCKIYE